MSLGPFGPPLARRVTPGLASGKRGGYAVYADPGTPHWTEFAVPLKLNLDLPRRLLGLPPRKRSFILALGGGGGRGLAHLGVLQALEEHGLRPDAIVGTSIGALFGAMYALEPDIERVREKVEAFLNSEAFDQLGLPMLSEAETTDQTWLGRLTAAARQSVLYARAARGIALVESHKLFQVVTALCGNVHLEDTDIPLHVTAVSFPHGEVELFSRGDMVAAIAASMAIPGVFEPVELAGRQYVDGGVASELPAREARNLARPDQAVIAVDVGARPDPAHPPRSVIGMLDWAMRVKSFYLRQYKSDFADLVVCPVPGFRQWNDFSHPDQEIERGHQSMLEHLPVLHRMLGR